MREERGMRGKRFNHYEALDLKSRRSLRAEREVKTNKKQARMKEKKLIQHRNDIYGKEERQKDEVKGEGDLNEKL